MKEKALAWLLFIGSLLVFAAGIWANSVPVSTCRSGMKPLELPPHLTVDEIPHLMELRNQLQRDLHNYNQKDALWPE